MGKITFTPIQQQTFDIIAGDKTIQKQFYFTGGTALSYFHLFHRYSEDLDFFTDQSFSSSLTNSLIATVADQTNSSTRFTQIHETLIYELVKEDSLLLKIDFAMYPYKRLEEGLIYNHVAVDSLIDIGANKIAAISDREEVKDFVDLYFILQTHTIWDLLRAYERKFRMELDLILITSNLLSVEKFDYLPKMVSRLSLEELKQYFLTLADKLSSHITE
jgi:predicted nucleotidyltransferase component of viral defense system